MMNYENASRVFQDLIATNNFTLESLFPEHGIDLMFQFYEDIRASKCPIEDDGDMLLVQWGTYNWDKTDFFEFNITRQ